MPIFWDIVFIVAYFIAGHVGGQALAQATAPKKAGAAVLVAFVVIAAVVTATMLWFPTKPPTPLDMIIWAVSAAIGFSTGYKRRRV